MTTHNKLSEMRIAQIAKQIKVLQKRGLRVVLVISGAVAYGSNFIDVTTKKDNLRQAAAGIGQIYIISKFNNIFVQNKVQLAQILLTKDGLREKSHKQNIQTLIEFYLKSGIIPFINENDVLDLNSFGGNDLLASEIASVLKAEKLIILSTMKGSLYGVGGGQTKQEAINILSKENIKVSIVNGKTKNILLQSLV